MASLVATPDPATGTVRIDVDQTIAYDTFSRIVANGWGSPDLGPAWTVSGGALADYSVNGTSGDHRHTAANVDHRSEMAQVVTDFEMSTTFSLSSVPFTGLWIVNLFGRLNPGPSQYVVGTLVGNPSGVVEIRIEYNDGAGNLITANVPLTGVNTSSVISFKFKACGNLLQARAWDATLPEVAEWQSELTVPTIFSGPIEINTYTAPGTTPMPFTFSFDFFQIITGNPLHLYRVTPDGVRTEVIGSPFSTNMGLPETATMWDGSAPFDVDIYYELTSDCSEDAVLTSNTVSLDSGGDGWLRDPLNPSLNLRIVMDDFFDECVDEDVIVFSGLDSREYENASGIFDHINAQRPITVSMTRKNYASALTLTSFSLDDVDSLEDIFQAGRILSLTLPMEYGWAHRTFGTDFITCFDITQSLLGVDQRVSTRVWTAPFRLSPEPADTIEGGVGGNGIGGGGATYDDLMVSALGVDYNSLSGSGNTYLQTAQGVGY